MGFWEKKIVFLTGASSGIGAEAALQMAQQGATVCLLARRKDALEEVAESISEFGGDSRVFAADVTDADGLRTAADAVRDEFGHIDILIANAGIGGNNTQTREGQPRAVKKVIDINLIGAMNSVGAVLPEMIERGSGHLVAISSLAGFRGLPKSAAYSASKAGMNAYFESLRLDFKGKGIDVSVVQPGFIKTPLTAGRRNKLPFVLEPEDGTRKIIKAIEKKKAFYAFPWQLATLVKLARFFPASVYDAIAGRATYRE